MQTAPSPKANGYSRSMRTCMPAIAAALLLTACPDDPDPVPAGCKPPNHCADQSALPVKPPAAIPTAPPAETPVSEATKPEPPATPPGAPDGKAPPPVSEAPQAPKSSPP